MQTIEFDGTIERTQPEVFDFVANAENQSRWSTEGTVYRKVTDGPIGIGTEFAFSGRLMGRRLEGTRTITAFERPTLVEFRSTEPVEFVGRYEFRPFDSGTHLTFRASGNLNGVMRLAAPVFLWMTRRLFVRDFRSLKTLLESRSSGTPS